ncbi:MAG: Fis family transcriptional regulator [Ignavibacteriales bacterium CG_4_9_14_3_um_filter_34_10]|nr:MAG: Fis family transcriptional regulator [Ignavibacteriales bacterium CG_4_9_14_3_um_filter_34_10]
MKNKIFILDDEKDICESIKMILDYEGYNVEFSTDPQNIIEFLSDNNFDVLLLDIQMPKMNGFEILNKIKENNITVSTIIISAFGNVENAIKATKLGAFDFIEKPIDRDKLLITIRNAVDKKNLVNENLSLKNKVFSEDRIFGKSIQIKNILETIAKVAKTDARILITGENGTGKELIAREIHKQSLRSSSDLIEVNCAAIPNELIESELFGHEKGSFTGAFNKRIGKFELADGGTLFLDEIGDMSLQAQAKVLRAIEDGKIERVGGNSKISVNVRIVSATNKDLQEEIAKGNFREDLFHRLNVIPIHISPLRERKEDIPELVNRFIELLAQKYNSTKIIFSDSAIARLQNLHWKGNVRELKNFIERVAILTGKSNLTDKDLSAFISNEKIDDNELFDISNSFQEFKEKAEKAFIVKQLQSNNWNISKTADVLGIQRSHLYGKMKKYKIEKE